MSASEGQMRLRRLLNTGPLRRVVPVTNNLPSAFLFDARGDNLLTETVIDNRSSHSRSLSFLCQVTHELLIDRQQIAGKLARCDSDAYPVAKSLAGRRRLPISRPHGPVASAPEQPGGEPGLFHRAYGHSSMSQLC